MLIKFQHCQVFMLVGMHLPNKTLHRQGWPGTKWTFLEKIHIHKWESMMEFIGKGPTVFIFSILLVPIGAELQGHGKKCKMKLLLGCLSVAMLVACKSEHFMHYTYNGTTITRVDVNNCESYFYYGNIKKSDDLPKNFFYLYYPGLDGYFADYLIFSEGKEVTFLYGGGAIPKQVGEDSLFRYKELNSEQQIAFGDSVDAGKLRNVHYVGYVLKTDDIVNRRNHSNVKATVR